MSRTLLALLLVGILVLAVGGWTARGVRRALGGWRRPRTLSGRGRIGLAHPRGTALPAAA